MVQKPDSCYPVDGIDNGISNQVDVVVGILNVSLMGKTEDMGVTANETCIGRQRECLCKS